MPSKDVVVLARKAQRQGWTIRLTSGGHYAFRAPSGLTVYAACSPRGGKRSLKNLRAHLKRAGLED